MKDEALFSHYIQSTFPRDGHYACYILSAYWSRLSFAVKEIMAAEIELSSTTDNPAHVSPNILLVGAKLTFLSSISTTCETTIP